MTTPGTSEHASYDVIGPANSAIGPHALVINNVGSLPLEWKRPQEIPQQLVQEGLGRAEQLKELRTQLSKTPDSASGGVGASVAVRGLPGVGKSTVAALYAARFASEYPGGVLWLTFGPELRGPESVHPFLNRIATYAYRADAQAQALIAGKQFSPEVVRSLLGGHGPLLLIADDLWDQAILGPLRRALPPEGQLLVTTRDARLARQAGVLLELDVLSEEDALACARRALPRMQEAQQRQLITAVGRHPLALAVALGDLADRGEEEWAGCIDRIAQLIAEGQGFGDLPLLDEADRESRVEATLRHSYEAMRPEFQLRFRALGCMAQEADFDTTAAATIWRDEEGLARGHLNILVARALIKRQPEERWQQHAILRAYALSLQEREERQALSQAHAQHYLGVSRACHESKPRDYNRLDREFRQVEHSFDWARRHNPKLVSRLVLLCNDFLRTRGRINLLKPWLQASLRAAESIGDSLGKANTFRSLGDLERHLGNPDAARRHYDEALPLYEAEQNLLGRANTLRSLGDLERHLGNPDAARRHYDEALSLFEAKQNRLGRANTLKSLGDLESQLGNLNAARRHYDEALPLFEAEQTRLGRANTLKSLGDLESRLGNLNAARRHYDEALPLFEAEQNLLGRANTLRSLGDLERHLGNLDAARRHYDEALPLFEAEQTRLGRANTLKSLGDLERHLGNLDAARRHYDEALPLYEAEQDRLGRANTLKSLGDLESYLGNPDAARRHYDEALPLYEAEQEPLGKMNIHLGLALLERGLGNLERAEEFYRQVLDQAQKIPGFANHPVTQNVRAEYQELLLEKNQE